MDITHVFDHYLITIGQHELLLADDDFKMIVICLAIGIPLLIVIFIVCVKIIKGIIKLIIKLARRNKNKSSE